MGEKEKAGNAAEDAWGKVKETSGEVTGNEELETEGRADQVDANAKQSGEHVKDAADKAGEAVNDAFRA